MSQEIKQLIEEEVKQYQQNLTALRGNKSALVENLENIETQIKNCDVQMNALTGAIESQRVLLQKIEQSEKVIAMPEAKVEQINEETMS